MGLTPTGVWLILKKFALFDAFIDILSDWKTFTLFGIIFLSLKTDLGREYNEPAI